MILIFDTETTGLPRNGMRWNKDYMGFPYVVQLSWKCSDDDEIRDYIIKPVGYVIPEEASKIHGITTEIALEKGVLFHEAINNFISEAYQAEKIIGHNIYFDTSIVKANILRHLQKIKDKYDGTNFFNVTHNALHKNKRIDTMKSATKFCNLPGPYGLKWPSLEELYYKLFKDTFPAHNSLEDVKATERCYYELIRLGII